MQNLNKVEKTISNQLKLLNDFIERGDDFDFDDIIAPPQILHDNLSKFYEFHSEQYYKSFKSYKKGKYLEYYLDVSAAVNQSLFVFQSLEGSSKEFHDRYRNGLEVIEDLVQEELVMLLQKFYSKYQTNSSDKVVSLVKSLLDKLYDFHKEKKENITLSDYFDILINPIEKNQFDSEQVNEDFINIFYVVQRAVFKKESILKLRDEFINYHLDSASKIFEKNRRIIREFLSLNE